MGISWWFRGDLMVIHDEFNGDSNGFDHMSHLEICEWESGMMNVSVKLESTFNEFS